MGHRRATALSGGHGYERRGAGTLFAAGINAWPVFAAVLTVIATCLGLAHFTSWKFPEDEWSAFWLLCAVLAWAGSPWLLVIYGI